jgi:xanthine dehydrogenase YagT iron-sulfur-binding subunit
MARDPDDTNCGGRPGVSRRGFIATVGTGAVAAATVAKLGADGAPAAPVPEGPEMVRVALDVNGRIHRLLVEPRWSLLYVLRERLGLTATKVGCERGECGACTVLINDRPRYACMALAVEAQHQRVITLEGLMKGEELGAVQKAFLERDALQCGYCTPGQIMAVEGLLRSSTAPSHEDIRLAVSGNLCRCGAYTHIFKAAARAAELARRSGGKP